MNFFKYYIHGKARDGPSLGMDQNLAVNSIIFWWAYKYPRNPRNVLAFRGFYGFWLPTWILVPEPIVSKQVFGRWKQHSRFTTYCHARKLLVRPGSSRDFDLQTQGFRHKILVEMGRMLRGYLIFDQFLAKKVSRVAFGSKLTGAAEDRTGINWGSNLVLRQNLNVSGDSQFMAFIYIYIYIIYIYIIYIYIIYIYIIYYIIYIYI